MIRIVSAFLFSIVLFSCDPGINDNSKRNENWAWIVDDSGHGEWVAVGPQGIVTGYFTLFYSTGEIYETGYVLEGNRRDTSIYYSKTGDTLRYCIHENDSTLHSYYYVDGDYTESYATGEVKLEGKVKNHDQYGYWTEHNLDGVVTWESDIRDGIGWEKTYYESGERLDSTNYIGDKQNGLHYNWYENGNLQQITSWKDEVQDGPQIFYFENGNVMESELKKDGLLNDTCKRFWENGKLKAINYQINDNKHGEFRRYYESGTIEVIGNFNYGVKEGKWYWYDSTGTLYQIDTYDDGVLVNIEKK